MSAMSKEELRSFTIWFVGFFGTIVLAAMGIAIYVWGWWAPLAVPVAVLALGFLRRAFMTNPPGRRPR